MSMKYVLDNEIERHQCNECSGMWFLFDHDGQTAYYRLSPIEPNDCSVCAPIDKEIEAGAIMTSERWV